MNLKFSVIKSCSLIMLLASVLTPKASAATNILELNLSNDISDSNIIYPESFETNTKEMLENWYLQQYTALDDRADNRATVDVSDQEIIERLGLLPFEIEMPYNSIVRSYIAMYADRKRQLVENMLGLGMYYMPIFEEALDRYGLPLELKYLAVIESALNPNAVSRAGATGLWQFMLPTAKGLGLEISTLVDERRDPYKASDAAARYLKQLYDMYGDWSLALAAYNCGPGNVNKALRREGTEKPTMDFWQIYYRLPQETRGYVPGFIAAAYVMNYYDKHGINPALAIKPIVTDTVHINTRVNFKQISDVLDIPMEELRVLNPQYRSDIIPGDIHPYALVLPSMQAYCFVANEDSILNFDASKYVRREVVEPSDGSEIAHNGPGTYVTKEVVKWHKVRKGETLKSIAKNYGVTTASIQKANGIGSKVKRGQKLKIISQEKQWVPEGESNGGEAVAQTQDTTTAATTEQTPQPVAQQPAQPKQQKQPAKPSSSKSTTGSTPSIQTTYSVRNGDTLSGIAGKYGVTVAAIKSTNGLRNDRLSIGQKLKIPAKAAPKSTSKSSSKTTAKSSSKTSSKKKKR